MTMSLALFAATAVILIVTLVWAARPRRQTIISAEDVFKALSEERHYARLPQILQSLQHDDIEYLRTRGHQVLWNRVRRERTKNAICYLEYLEREFQALLEASRILARMAPQLSTMREFDRFVKALQFVLYCRYLRWRLRFGMEPWKMFNAVSDMAGAMTLQLEAAMARLGESVARNRENPLPPNHGSGYSL